MAHLQKGRAFVPGARGLTEREYCTLCIEHPSGTRRPLCLRAEAVWIDEHPLTGGIGVQFLDFDAAAREALRAFVDAGAGPLPPAPEPVSSQHEPSAADPGSPEASQAGAPPSARDLHARVRDLDLRERDALARQGSLPERVALERRFASSVWEGLLHNPQLTAREVLRMAKSGSLATTLLGLIVANKAWLADSAIQTALLANPRVTGNHLDRVLGALSQTELARVSEQQSQRMQVRIAAKRWIRK